MTKITCEQIGSLFLLEVDGHATGCQEACSGISAIVEALGTYIRQPDNEHVSAVSECMIDSGYCLFKVEGDEALAQVWKLAHIGLAQIAMAHPAFVSI